MADRGQLLQRSHPMIPPCSVTAFCGCGTRPTRTDCRPSPVPTVLLTRLLTRHIPSFHHLHSLPSTAPVTLFHPAERTTFPRILCRFGRCRERPG